MAGQLLDFTYFEFHLIGIFEIGPAGFIAVRKENAIQERNVILHKFGSDLPVVTAGNEGQPGINFPCAIEHLLQMFRSVSFQIVGEVIDAPGDEICFAQTQFGKLNRPSFIIEFERFHIHLMARKGFRRRNNGSPHSDAFFPGQWQKDLEIVPVIAAGVKAEAVGIGMDIDQFANELFNIDATIW